MKLSIHEFDNGWFLLNPLEYRERWGVIRFEARYLVTIERYQKHTDPEQIYSFVETEEFKKTIELVAKPIMPFVMPDGSIAQLFHEKYTFLNHKTVDWLNDNVKPSTAENPTFKQSWDYISWNSTNQNIFFRRKSDALKFIKTFGDGGKPTEIYDQRDHT